MGTSQHAHTSMYTVLVCLIKTMYMDKKSNPSADIILWVVAVGFTHLCIAVHTHRQICGSNPGTARIGAENLVPTGIWSPDHPACRKLLYGLCYPSSYLNEVFCDLQMVNKHRRLTLISLPLAQQQYRSETMLCHKDGHQCATLQSKSMM